MPCSRIFQCSIFLVFLLSTFASAFPVRANTTVDATVPTNTSMACQTAALKVFSPDLALLTLPPETDREANWLQLQIRHEQVANGEKSGYEDPTEHRLCVKDCVMDHCKDICAKEWYVPPYSRRRSEGS
ncbi:hypothetical protein B0T21DRAFT_123728 [Apiosordaria backusii]|uniref:Secreted protein n=1 Tax=Apiosordaria backusii TaxID=314023 RepID=A0AA40EMJ7_9PEZI|nr:hypothetical protein B0T21DRAFT_123728 [Apiosordaria backusii]